MRKLSKHPGKVERRKPRATDVSYRELLSGVVCLIEQARLAAVRSVNTVLTSTYWLVGQRIVEHEQSGSERAAYGQALLKRLSQDLTAQVGRGFSERNLEQMRLFYLGWPNPQTVSAEFRAAVDFADAVCEIRLVASIPLAMVPLRPTFLRRRSPRTRVLRAGGVAGRLVGTPTRSSDRQPCLSADEQGEIRLSQRRNAPSGCARSGSIRPRVSESERRIFGDRS